MTEGSGVEVGCLICGYETVLFEGHYDKEDGEPCPNCGQVAVNALDSLFKEHPLYIVDDSPGLIKTDDPAYDELSDQYPVLLDLAEKHEVIDGE